MNILLGVTGSVAATLTKKMVTALQSLGTVEVVMTGWGSYFPELERMGSALINRPFEPNGAVRVWQDSDEWNERNPSDHTFSLKKVWNKKGDPVRHIDLRKWAGALVIAPLSANTMAKMANGICDNLLTSIYRAWDRTRPVIVAPGMNTLMWEHPITAKHVGLLGSWDVQFVGPVSKTLACNDEGMGAMAHIDDIVAALKDTLRWQFPLIDCNGLPGGTHPGAFATCRRLSHHTGIDLYCEDGAVVKAVEHGRLLGWEKFTGPQDKSPWWLDTDAVLVEGASGVVCYGEIKVSQHIKDKMEMSNPEARVIRRGEIIGYVKPVVPEGRERPDIPGHSRSMLHMELYERGQTKASERWELDKPKPDYLLDPTPWLVDAVGCPKERLDMPSWPASLEK
jgi:phosphopantothenoylcysteine decarboxylase